MNKRKLMKMIKTVISKLLLLPFSNKLLSNEHSEFLYVKLTGDLNWYKVKRRIPVVSSDSGYNGYGIPLRMVACADYVYDPNIDKFIKCRSEHKPIIPHVNDIQVMPEDIRSKYTMKFFKSDEIK